MRCSYCGSEYTSVLALDACEDEHQVDDTRNRAWVKTHPTGAVRGIEGRFIESH